MKRFRVAVALAAAFLLFSVLALEDRTATGHIIPPENLHPVAEGYRNAVFILNHNPIVWDQIWPVCETVSTHLEAIDSTRAAAFRTEIEKARSVVFPLPAGDEEPDPVEAREKGRRAVFVALTRAVASLALERLELARTDPKRTVVKENLNEARRILEAFAPVVEATDPTAWASISRSFLEASTRLGSDGVLGAGAVPMDQTGIAAALEGVERYIRTCWLEYQVGDGRRLSPRPASSPSFDPRASVPTRLPPGSQINKQVPRPRQILGMASRGVDESETNLIALGDMAFDSAYIFGEPARSIQLTCNTCHNKGVANPNFFVPGLSGHRGSFDVSNSFFAPHANDGVFNPVDIPDLRGIRFTAPYGRDGRFASLRDFTRNVIVHEFNGPEPEPILVDGMVAYMNQFEFLPNPNVRPDGTLAPNRVSGSALRGEEIFRRDYPQMMGGTSCASCHIPSGRFLDHQQHDLGTKEGAEPHSQDRALDTPTLLGVKWNGPYFHDGRFGTLREVVDWFDRRFGLGLADSESADLTAYLETIGDGIEAYEASPYYLDAEMEEFSFFLSTYEWLRERGRSDLIQTTLQTVSAEIANHKWELQDSTHRPVMERLAAILDEAYALEQAGRHDPVDLKIEEYRRLYRENAENLR